MFPFQDNPVMHTYAGLLALHLAQPSLLTPNDASNGLQPFPRNLNYTGVPYRSHRRPGPRWNEALLSAAQAHFEHTKRIDPENTVATGFLEQVRCTAQGTMLFPISSYCHVQLPDITRITHTRAAESDDEGQGGDMDIDDPNQRRKRIKT